MGPVITVPFFGTQAQDGAVALVEAATGRQLTYSALADRVLECSVPWAGRPRSLAFCLLSPEIDPVARYLGCLAGGHAVAVVDPATPTTALAGLVERYRPEILTGPVADIGRLAGYPGYRPAADGVLLRYDHPPLSLEPPHPDLALLLSTSGSTGSPKLVRLSSNAVRSNALSIASYLDLGPQERAVTSLPLFYTYGLSVLHSHLASGASVVLTTESVLRPGFWSVLDANRVTSFAGVPYTYQMLQRLAFEPRQHSSLRTLTQAGGRLGPELVEWFASRMGPPPQRRFIVMYGQTEATARMSWLPHERLADKLGSVGTAIPGGRFEAEGSEASPGEVHYRGPNVMMGYACDRQDLALGDLLHGVLATGDLGYLDADGFLFLTGRRSRFAKVYGTRVSLDDVEDLVRPAVACAATSRGDRIVLYCEGSGADQPNLRLDLAQRLGLHSSAIDVHWLPELPRRASGKIDYALVGTTVA